MNLFEKYTLNEQLQQAYEAGRRRGLNEQRGAAMPSAGMAVPMGLNRGKAPEAIAAEYPDGFKPPCGTDGTRDCQVGEMYSCCCDSNGHCRSYTWVAGPPPYWHETGLPNRFGSGAYGGAYGVNEQFRGSEPIHGVPTHTPPNYSPPSTQSNPGPPPAGGSEIMYYYGTGQYLPNHLLWADHDGDGMFGWNDYIYLSAAHGGGFVGPM